MAQKFSHEETVMFDQVIDGFDDMLIIGKAAQLYPMSAGGDGTSPSDMEHQLDKFWIPAPLISASFDGFDQTLNFASSAELVVPVSIGFHKSVPITLTSKNLRNERYLTNRGIASKQKLASDVNYAVFSTVALQGTIVVKQTTPAVGFDDVSLCDASMTEIGVPQDDRMYFAAPRVANLMAGDLARRQTFQGPVQDAYEAARIGLDIAGFDVFKNDQTIRLTAAAGGVTTVNGANQYWVPTSYSVAATGEISNVDNRGMNLAITSANYAGIQVGDAFNILGVDSIHMVTKRDTGQLLTFRVVAKPAAGIITVYPAIISGQGGTQPEKEYQNASATPAAGAAITWLNTVTAPLNPFFRKEALILVPGSFVVDPEDGWNVMQATTELGISITYARQGNINDLTVKARWDLDFGTALTNPQMAGVELFNQV